MISKVNTPEKNEPDVRSLFSNEVILDQVKRILKYRAFKVSKVLSAFLTYIVHEAIDGRAEQLKEYNIAVHVFRKPLDFNPGECGVVRVNARRLRDALNDFYSKNNKENGCEIFIPKGGYIPVFKSPKWLGPLPVQLRSYRSPLPGEKIKIAVMPFRSQESVRSKLSMIDSVGQMLCTEFSMIPCFSVLSYYTTWQMQSANVALQDMHFKYDTQFALTGSIEVGPKRIFVFLQLVKVETEMLIWSDILELEDIQYQNPGVARIIVSRIMSALQRSGDLFDIHYVDRLADRDMTGYKNMYQIAR